MTSPALSPAQLLKAYAQLSTKNRSTASLAVASRAEDFAWLGLDGLNLLAHSEEWANYQPVAVGGKLVPSKMRSLDALHPNEHLLRIGWGWISGTLTNPDGPDTTVLTPILSAPIEAGRYTAKVIGDSEVSHLIEDPTQRAELEERATLGGGALDDNANPDLLNRLTGLLGWMKDVADAAGLPVSEHRSWRQDAWQARKRPGLRLHVGFAVYLARDTSRPDLTTSLTNWSATEGLANTAFGALARPARDRRIQLEPVRSNLALLPDQRRVVMASRQATLTAVTGAPGTGKTHTLIAATLDALRREETVLIATSSSHAADVVARMLDRQPGPTPVLFGSSADRDTLADRLTETAGNAAADVARARSAEHDADAQLGRCLDEIELLLDLDRLADSVPVTDPDRELVFTQATNLLDPACDLDHIEHLAHAARRPRFWQRSATRNLHTALGAPLGPDRVPGLVAAARSIRAANRLATVTPEGRAASWTGLEAALATWRSRSAELDAASSAQRDRTSAGAISELAAILRQGRAQRRSGLRELHGAHALRGAPVWIGTLGDIDDLLPPTPGLFDLVLLDEASQVDQPSAAPALLRGRRAVVVGDPRQLRHVSFISDDAVGEALDTHLGDSRSQLFDIRRSSIHDLAVGRADTHLSLNDHVRSAPHLISFSAERFYDQRLRIMTRHPSNETEDRIHVIEVIGERSTSGVNQPELDRVIELLAQAVAAGETDIGLISPFRAQADALEQAVIAAFPVETIERVRLQVGTVHSFQGSERDTVIASLVATADDPPGRRRFLSDAHLMNVLLTRARRQLVLVSSLGSNPGGLVGDVLRHSHDPPRPVTPLGPSNAFVDEVSRELSRQGVTSVAGYPVGRWSIDLVVGRRHAAFGVNLGPHPDGLDAHVERHLTLTSFGWTLVDASPRQWDDNPATAAIELAALAQQRRTSERDRAGDPTETGTAATSGGLDWSALPAT